MSLNIRRSLQKLFDACPLTAYLFIPVIRMKDILDGKPMHRSMEKNTRLFCTPEQLKDRAYLRRLKRDMWYSFLRYYCGFDEYFQLQFPKRSHAGRREFVTDFERIAVCTPLVDPEMMALFKNKWNTYEALKDFYHRDAVKVCPGSSPDDFFRFADAHPLFIAKPLEESCGIGVHLVELTPETDREALFRQLQQENVILEEKIVQCETLSALHPASVNTIRCATFLKDGEVHILFTFLRIGQKNSVVDNGGAGGLIACIDKSNEPFQCVVNGQLNEANLKGKLVGLLFREEEYIGSNDGKKHKAVKACAARSVQTIREGSFDIPEPKLLQGNAPSRNAAPTAGFTQVDDEELPF